MLKENLDLIFQLLINCKKSFFFVFIQNFKFSFTSNQRYLSLNMFFENGEHARRIMEPKEDQVRYTFEQKLLQ